MHTIAKPTATATKPRLMDQVRSALRVKHYALTTERTYCHWIKRYIRHFDCKRHPADMGAEEVEAFLSHLAIFDAQRPHSQLADGRIFLNPETGDPWWDTSSLVQRYWRPTLRRLGIRDRDARQTRHTCATLMLMAGCNPAWCAAQLGHSPELFWRTYSRWIQGADRGAELEKLSKLSQRFHKAR